MLTFPSELSHGNRALLFPDKRLPLRAMLGSVGWSRETATTYDWHGLRRGRAEFTLFQYTLAGRGRLRIGDTEYDVLPGQAMLLRFPEDNRYWLPSDSAAWEFIYVCLHGRETLRLWPSIVARLGPVPSLGAESRSVACAASIVTTALRGELASPFLASARAYELTMALADETKTPVHAPSPHAAALARALALGEKRLSSPLTVDDLARAAGLSRFHFTRLFTAQTGATPIAWLTDLRLKEAARLLRTTSLPLKAVATRCGFSDPNYFGKVFRAHTGQTPGGYRRSGW